MGKLIVEKAQTKMEEAGYTVITVEKDFEEDLGVVFTSAVFDGLKKCCNHCEGKEVRKNTSCFMIQRKKNCSRQRKKVLQLLPKVKKEVVRVF